MNMTINKRRCLWFSFWLVTGVAIALPVSAADQIIEIKGSVSIKRSNSSQYQSASVGTQLNEGDLIRPARGARVIVRCANRTVWSVPAGIESGLGAGCPESISGRPRLLGGRGSDDFLAFLNQSFVPSTQILEANPLLRWAAIPDAKQYHIQVSTGDRLLWQTTTSDTTSQYQGEPLQPDKNYQLIVTATNTQGIEQTTKLLFRTLAGAEANTIKTARDRIQTLDLSDEAKAIALAALYQEVAQPNTDPPANQGLLLEALPPLETLMAANTQTPYVHRLLGDLYLHLGWFDLAQLRYQKAIELARFTQDRQDWAAAQVGLASIAALQQDIDQARSALQAAKIGYRLLGNTTQVERIEQWIEKLNL